MNIRTPEGTKPADPVSVRPAENGTTEIVISLTSEQAAALGFDAWQLADYFHSAMLGIEALRTGTEDRRKIDAALFAVTRRIEHRMEGLGDALVRRHAELGGSLGDLATAMGAPRSTVQSRRKVVMRRPAGAWENWATGTRSTPGPGQHHAE